MDNYIIITNLKILSQSYTICNLKIKFIEQVSVNCQCKKATYDYADPCEDNVLYYKCDCDNIWRVKEI